MRFFFVYKKNLEFFKKLFFFNILLRFTPYYKIVKSNNKSRFFCRNGPSPPLLPLRFFLFCSKKRGAWIRKISKIIQFFDRRRVVFVHLFINITYYNNDKLKEKK